MIKPEPDPCTARNEHTRIFIWKQKSFEFLHFISSPVEFFLRSTNEQVHQTRLQSVGRASVAIKRRSRVRALGENHEETAASA